MKGVTSSVVKRLYLFSMPLYLSLFVTLYRLDDLVALHT